MKKYCYKVKHGFLKDHDGYSKIEEFGFARIMEEFEPKEEGGEKTIEWTKGWAIPITLAHDTVIGNFLKSETEKIYSKEKDKKDSKWLKELSDSGYDFDADGKLIENEKVKEPVEAQVCIFAEGELSGTLFISVGGFLEFYDVDELNAHVKDIIDLLDKNKVIYQKRLRG